MSAVITSDYFIIIHTSRTKGYVHKSVHSWSLNCSIVPVFWSLFEVSFQNISPFSNRIKPNLFETLSDATESNTQRNKLSLQATTSSGISHFRKTHLKRREVVMCECKWKGRGLFKIWKQVLTLNYLGFFKSSWVTCTVHFQKSWHSLQDTNSCFSFEKVGRQN